MDPGDVALLSDLLDGRLDPAAEASLRRRLHEEQDLADAWDDLRRIREGLRALPGPAVPAGFSEGVRRRIAAGEGAGEAAEGRRSIAAYAAAAVLAAGLGVGAYALAIRGQRAEPDRGTVDAVETASPSDDAPFAKADESSATLFPGGGVPATLEDKVAGAGEKSVDPTRPVPPRGPLGAVPPGLREPSDEPVPLRPRGAGAGGGGGGASAGGSAPPATTPAPAPAPTAGYAAPSTAPPATPPPNPAPRPAPAPRPGATDPRFQEGVDEVLTIDAADLEEGRARLFLLLGEVRLGRDAAKDEEPPAPEPAPTPPPPVPPAPAPEERPAEEATEGEEPAEADARAKEGGDAEPGSAPTGGVADRRGPAPSTPSAPGAEAPAPPAAPAPPPRPVLGTVLLTLTDRQLEGLRTRLGPAPRLSRKAGDAPGLLLRVRVLVVAK